MILKELSLENVRSYKEATVRFEEGSTLLSGDIGSGKTSILLGIEFALFGLLRGEISGDHLLRFGCKEAKVKLVFEIGDDTVEILRVLKKSGGSVQQSSGHVGVNGVFEEKTAQEIKSTVLDILGYPSDLLHKNPEMFRYTVYTPQEDMKKILYEKEEDRLVQLRKVFDLDKYERIKNNAELCGRELRRKKRNLQNKFEDLSDAKEELKQIKEELKQKRVETKKVVGELKKKLVKQESVQEEIARLEESEERIQKNESELAKVENSLKYTSQRLVDIQAELKDLKPDDEDELDEKPVKSLTECKELLLRIQEKEKMIQEKKEKANKKLTSVLQRIQDSQKLIEDINELDDCPTCNQKVTKKHKEEVERKERQKIKKYKNKKEQYQAFKQEITQKKKILNDKKDKVQILLQKAKSYEDKKLLLQKAKKTRQRQKKQRQKLKQETKKLEKQKKQLQTQKTNLEEKVNKHKEFKQKLKQKRNELQTLQQQISQHQIKKTKLESSIEYKNKEIQKQKRDIKDMQEFKKVYEETRKVENWLSNHFTNVITTIEKHVFMKIHERFNTYFQNWFNILIEDEDFMARLNNNFTPLLSQNNHETTIKNLSGGEKTSVALSYRLALNRVVNEFLTGIKTKNLLILDEPTDGFSIDQLDKVRDVLDALDCKQTIIVSHEPKLESYTENIIRIQKKHGESHIA